MSEEKKSDRIIEELKKKLEELLDGGSEKRVKFRKWSERPIESYFDEWFGWAYKDLSEDQRIFLDKPTQNGGEDLIILLLKLWIANFKRFILLRLNEIGESVKRPSLQILGEEITKLRLDLRRQGEEYKKFWLVKKNYDGIVKKFKDLRAKEEIMKRYARDLFYYSQGGERERKHRKNLTVEEDKNKEKEVEGIAKNIRWAFDRFLNDLEEVRKGVEIDLKKDFWEKVKEWVYPVVPAAAVLLLGILEYCTRD